MIMGGGVGDLVRRSATPVPGFVLFALDRDQLLVSADVVVHICVYQ